MNFECPIPVISLIYCYPTPTPHPHSHCSLGELDLRVELIQPATICPEINPGEDPE